MSQDPVHASPDTELVELSQLMTKHRLRFIPIVATDGSLRGVVSREALLNAHQRLPRTRMHTERRVAAQIMERDFQTMNVDDCAYDAGHLLLDSHVECLPIVDRNNRLVGLLTEADFVRFTMRRAAA